MENSLSAGDQHDAAADETTPLLPENSAERLAHSPGSIQTNDSDIKAKAQRNGNPQEHSTQPAAEDDDTPLPRVQIFLLCSCATTEPIAYFCIFPFINQMINETGMAEEDVGFWSGMIESLFSLTQMVLMIPYGRAADHLGRKPVLVFSLAGMGIAQALFGLSKSLWQMIMFRCLAGVFGGSAVTVRAMLSENGTAKTQARAFSLYAFVRNLGVFIGPLFGGVLSKPVEQYPSLFHGNSFMKEYPYALPTFLTGAIMVATAILSMLFVRETLDRKAQGSSAATKRLSTLELLKTPGVGAVLYLFSHVMLLGYSFTAVAPVFLFTDPRLGGFGFSPQWISIFLAICGASQALWILLAFPPLQRRWSTGAVLRGCAAMWPVFFLIFPLGNELLRHNFPHTPFLVIFTIATAFGSAVSMAFTCVQLALNDIAPSPTALATLNAFALTLNSAIRAVAPALFSALFATGIKIGVLDGHLIWVILIATVLGLVVGVRWLPAKAEGKIRESEVSS